MDHMNRRSFLNCAAGGALGGLIGMPMGGSLDRRIAGRAVPPDLTLELDGYYIDCRILDVSRRASPEKCLVVRALNVRKCDLPPEGKKI